MLNIASFFLPFLCCQIEIHYTFSFVVMIFLISAISLPCTKSKSSISLFFDLGRSSPVYVFLVNKCVRKTISLLASISHWTFLFVVVQYLFCNLPKTTSFFKNIVRSVKTIIYYHWWQTQSVTGCKMTVFIFFVYLK